MDKGKKRLFILLGMVTLLVYGAVFGFIWFLMTSTSPAVRHIAVTALAAGFVMLMIAMTVGLGGLVLGLMFGGGTQWVQKSGRGIVELFYPMVLRVGRFIGISKEEIEDSYIKINNQITVAAAEKFRPEEVLVLAPHCLQNTSCPHKITIDVHNCHRCGKCSIDGLLTIAEDTGVNFVVASGGTFARKFAKEYNPKAIVAIACERDLTSGIKDMNVQRIPVVGVLNDRPNGPCHNTSVQLCKVRQAIASFTEA
ncbi:MAG: DUF116 domain-containing protein [Peptococcaceae bacterium]|nr:DUF116 domain-containing protein [Peptococcaceae bacterium]